MLPIDFQNRIIDKIISRDIVDFDSFIISLCDDLYSGFIPEDFNPKDSRGKTYTIIDGKEREVYDCICIFVTLLDRLVDLGLIKIVRKSRYYIVGFSQKTSALLGSLLNEYHGWVRIDGRNLSYPQLDIIPLLGELEEYKNRGYRSVDEYRLSEEKIARDEEKSAREKSLFWTRFVAIASVVVSIVSLSISSYYYNKYTNERKVELINQCDTTKVLILNDEQQDLVPVPPANATVKAAKKK